MRIIFPAAVLAAGLLALYRLDSPQEGQLCEGSPSSSSNAPIRSADNERIATVRVEHAYVTAQPDPDAIVMDEAPPPSTARITTEVPRTAKAVHVAPRRQRSPENLVTKATRAFLGDGRHRPQPFPRANQ